MKNKALICIVLLIVVFTFVITPYDSSAGGKRDYVIFEVTKVKGYVKVKLPEAKNFSALKEGDKIKKDSIVITGKQSTVELRGFKNKAYIIRLMETTFMKIESISFDNTKIFIEEGSVFVNTLDTVKIEKKVFKVTTPIVAAELEPQSAIYIDVKTSNGIVLKGKTHLMNYLHPNFQPLEHPEIGTSIKLKPDDDPKEIKKATEDVNKTMDKINGASDWEKLTM